MVGGRQGTRGNRGGSAELEGRGGMSASRLPIDTLRKIRAARVSRRSRDASLRSSRHVTSRARQQAIWNASLRYSRQVTSRARQQASSGCELAIFSARYEPRASASDLECELAILSASYEPRASASDLRMRTCETTGCLRLHVSVRL